MASSFTDRTKRSANAFNWGDRGGRGTRLTPASSRSCLKAAQHFVSRSWIRYGLKASPPLHRHIAGDLLHPGLIGMGCDACNMDTTRIQLNEKQDEVRHEPTPCSHFRGEKVGGHQHVKMHADELFPRRGRLALWSRWKPASFEDVAHGLITHLVP
jgi:hypothetical protein